MQCSHVSTLDSKRHRSQAEALRALELQYWKLKNSRAG